MFQKHKNKSKKDVSKTYSENETDVIESERKDNTGNSKKRKPATGLTITIHAVCCHAISVVNKQTYMYNTTRSS